MPWSRGVLGLLSLWWDKACTISILGLSADEVARHGSKKEPSHRQGAH